MKGLINLALPVKSIIWQVKITAVSVLAEVGKIHKVPIHKMIFCVGFWKILTPWKTSDLDTDLVYRFTGSVSKSVKL